MLNSRQRRVFFALSLAILAVTATVAMADPIQMHPQGEALPFDHQGPFVTTGNGGVLAMGVGGTGAGTGAGAGGAGVGAAADGTGFATGAAGGVACA